MGHRTDYRARSSCVGTVAAESQAMPVGMDTFQGREPCPGSEYVLIAADQHCLKEKTNFPESFTGI